MLMFLIVSCVLVRPTLAFWGAAPATRAGLSARRAGPRSVRPAHVRQHMVLEEGAADLDEIAKEVDTWAPASALELRQRTIIRHLAERLGLNEEIEVSAASPLRHAPARRGLTRARARALIPRRSPGEGGGVDAPHLRGG